MENVHTLIHYTHFWTVTENDLSSAEQSIQWQGFNSIRCPLMLRANYRCVQSLNISVDDAKCVENVHKFTKFIHFLSLTKNDLSRLNNHFVARFQFIMMSSYAKNKQYMFSVIKHQCRRRQMCGKVSTNLTQYTLFLSVTKWLLVLTEQSILWQRSQLIREHP